MPEEERETLAQDEASETASSPGGRGMRKLIALLVIILIQIGLAYGVARFLILPRLPGAGDGADSLAVAQVPEIRERGQIIMMDDVVVNLLGKDSSHFLKVTTGLEFKDKKLEQEIGDRMPELRDMLIGHLANRRIEEVVSREGRELIKSQLIDDYNATLQGGQLLNIYFSNFVVQ